MSRQGWRHAFCMKWVTSQYLPERMCMRSYSFSLELEKSTTYKCMQSTDFFNFKEILGQVNRFLEGTFQHNKYHEFCPGKNEWVGPEEGSGGAWDRVGPQGRKIQSKTAHKKTHGINTAKHLSLFILWSRRLAPRTSFWHCQGANYISRREWGTEFHTSWLLEGWIQLRT